MNTIPPATAAKLASPPVKGTRHQEMIDLAVSLIGSGITPPAVFTQLRSRYPSDVSDTEISKVVGWAESKHPTPPGRTNGNGHRHLGYTRPSEPPKSKQRTPEEQVEWWLSGSSIDESKFSESSPIRIPESPKESLVLMLEMLYSENEFVNIVCDYIVNEGKANPQGSGKTLVRRDWVDWISQKGVPQSKAGAWVRPNPCLSSSGSGKNGAITDEDIGCFRFMLLEWDKLPVEKQLALYSKFKLPIAAVIRSGGKSVHAWVKIEAPDELSYQATVAAILEALAPFGIDKANKNPSRLSRLASATRTIGGFEGGFQKLLYLNPKAEPITQEGLERFKESLLLAAVDEKPLKSVFKEALARYDELEQNRGKIGVLTGISPFDRDSGGFKNGTFIVIAAETGGGKSSLAMNFINHAIHNQVGVALFSLEMDRGEVVDLVVSMNCKINRNVFNTGFFSEQDTAKIFAHGKAISELPLWIFDDPIMTSDDVRRRVLQLKSENKIGLVVVDYVQLLSSHEVQSNREQQIASISRSLRALAKEARVPVIALSQLNDEGKLRESRVLSHDAHIVFLLEELEDDARLKVVKGRSIPKRTYELSFQPEYCIITHRSLEVPDGYKTITPRD